MKTSIIHIDANMPQIDRIRQVVAVLNQGGIVAVPTETVFGLACDMANAEAVKRLYTIKNRPEDKPFVIQAASVDKVLNILGKQDAVIENLLRNFWPGPLTTIIDSKDGKKGFRVPDSKVALAVLAQIGRPLVVTSANLSGKSALNSPDDINKHFNGLVDMIIDNGNRASGIESTILDCTVTPFKFLRKGAIARALEQYIMSTGHL